MWWKPLWKYKCPTKDKNFMWILLNNKIFNLGSATKMKLPWALKDVAYVN
jgi:hypothetical protein